MLKQMGVTIIRQGGSFTITDYYDWTKWIGPAYERPTMQAEWGDEVIAGWGYVLFFKMAQTTHGRFLFSRSCTRRTHQTHFCPPVC
jgi:alpha-L-arabinofuranosidase